MNSLLTTLLAVAFVFELRADEFSQWEWLVPTPVGDHLAAITFDGTRFIAVGEMGVILTSTNGADWRLTYTDTTNKLWGVTVGDATVLAYGDNSTVLASSGDATTWRSVETGSDTAIHALTYGNNTYVALDFSWRVFISTNADTGWHETLTPPDGAANDIEFGDGKFVAVGWNGLIATSSDGVGWTTQVSGTDGPIWAVTYGDGKWVAVGGEEDTGFILTSFNGTDWFLQLTDTPMYSVTYGPYGFIATGGDVMGSGVSMNSSDGIYFSGGEPGGSGLSSVPAGVACGNGVCVAVGGPGQIWTTTDGSAWVSQSSGQDLTVTSLVSNGAKLVGVGGKGTIVTSSDGLQFESHIYSTNENYFKVIATDHGFVAAGANGIIRTSADGTDWNLENTSSDATLKDLAFGGGKVVAIGWNASGKPYGQFLVRDSNADWQAVWPAADEFINSSIAFGNGHFVASGYYGEVWISDDGTQWQKSQTGIGETILPIQFINGQFIGLTSGSVGFSNDGVNWNFTTTTPPAVKQLAFGNGLYIAAGWNRGGIEISED
ncbi:hypothetical protein GC207_00765 [bacterium]|nr:hypothetical protein [bacterium]